MQPEGPTKPFGDERSRTTRTAATKKASYPLMVASCVAVAAVLFTADVLTPSGVTPTIGYCVVPLLAVQTGRRWFVVGMTGLCTLLTWVVYFLEPPGAPAWMSVFERSILTGVLWFAFVLVWQRRNAQSALARQAQVLEDLNRELRRSNQELDAFASVASHDIRGPLATTEMLANLAESHLAGKIDQHCAEWLSLIRSEIQRMHSIVENLLEYSRFNRDRSGVVEFECEAVLATVLDGLKADLTANRAQVTHDPLPRVRGDPMQLAVLFQNLIENAIKYRSDAQPKIHLSVAAEQDGWRFSVEDNGIGIDPADEERIFRLFERGEGSKTAMGAGIGLATCKKIVELHGGRIWVESARGSGSTFHFTIAHPYGLSAARSAAAKEGNGQAKSATAS
jgi:signal transduction histidine kinase